MPYPADGRVRLVDIPPEDLLQRLAEGKVYVPDQAAKALEKFFKPGNLMALREISLRRTAARVDDQMRAYMETQSITGPWPTMERLMVCVSGSPNSEKLIRSTSRLAEELKAHWITVYIETPESGQHARENRENVWRDLRLAESLGGAGNHCYCVLCHQCDHRLRHAAQHYQDRDGQAEQTALAGVAAPTHR